MVEGIRKPLTVTTREDTFGSRADQSHHIIFCLFLGDQ